MKFVYLLQSIPHPERRYIGLTTDLDRILAADFEKYLKSGSGRAFADKRFWSD
jgi:hypothetical protein